MSPRPAIAPDESPPSAVRRWSVAACALGAGAIALTMLSLCHFVESHGRTEFDLEGIAPSTAACMLLLSAALAWRQWKGPATAARVAVGVAGAVTAAIAATELAARFPALGAARSWQIWLESAVTFNLGASIRPMASASAVLLLLSAGAMSLALLPKALRPRSRHAAMAVSAVVAVFAVLIAGLDLVDANLLLPSEALRVPSKWPALALALLNVGLLTELGCWSFMSRLILGPPTEPGPAAATERTRRRWAVLGLWAVTGVSVAAALSYFQLHIVQTTEELERNLRQIVAANAAHIAEWHNERLGDARALMAAPMLAESVVKLEGGTDDREARAHLTTYFETLRRAYGYRAIVLYDRNGTPVLTAEGARPPALNAEDQSALRASREPIAREMSRDAVGEIAVDFLAPLRTATRDEFVGAVALRVDPRQRLFPLALAWREQSESAENLVIRRDGQSVIYLNDLRFKPDSAVKLRLPLDRTELLTVKVLRGNTAKLVQGLDYRGALVLGVGWAVPGTTWFVLSKLDAVEAFGSARSEAVRVTWSLLVGLATLVLSFGLVWRQRTRGLVERQGAAERARGELAQKLGAVMQHAKDGFILFDEEARIVEVNESAAKLYGRSVAEMAGLRAQDLRTAESRASMSRDFAAALTEAGTVFETLHARQDGTAFPVEVSARAVLLGGRRHVLSVVREITQRKQHEHEIEHLSRLYLVIGRINRAIVHEKTQPGLFAAVCRVLAEVGGFKLAWIGWHDPDARRITPVAVEGPATDYAAGLDIATHDGSSGGRGPSGTAFREGRTYVCNDFFGDPHTLPWRARAEHHGLRSSVSLPLKRGGRPVGLLAVYAGEKDCFAPADIALLESAAGEVSFALDVIAGEERRREVERALRESETRLGFLLAATPAVIYSLRAAEDFATTFISENIRDVLGYAPADFQADPSFWVSHLHPEEAAAVVAALADVRDRDRLTREYRFRHADGSYRWMLDKLRVVRDITGRPREFVGYWLDITEKTTAEQALRARTEIFLNIVAQAGDAIALIDAETGRFTEFNRMAHDWLGYTREEFAGFTVREIEADLSEDQVRQRIQEAIARGQVIFETRHRHRDGSARDMRINARAIKLQGRDYLTTVWSDITEARKAEAEMRRLSLVVEQSPSSIVVTDLTGAIEYVNPRFTELSGYPLEELRGRNPRVFKSGLTPPEVYTDLWQTITAGRTWRGEIINRKKNGEVFTELVVIAPVKDAQGVPTHFVALKEDITLRRQAQEALQESEANFRQLVAMAPFALAESDAAGHLLMTNERFHALFGYSAEEVAELGLWWSRAYPDARYRAEVVARWEQALQTARAGTGRLSGFECDVTCKDGQVRTVDISAILLGRNLLVAFVDVTERVTKEKKLRQLTRTIEQAPLSIVITDLTGAIEYVNPRFCEITGYTTAEVIGQNPRVLKSGDTAAEVYTDMWATLARGAVWRGELINRKKNAEHYVERAVIAPVADEGGRVTHYVALKEDITERKRTDQALQETQARYQLIADNTSDAIWLYDLGRRVFTYMSPASERLLGFKPNELVGQPITRALTPAAAVEAAQNMARRLAAFRAGDRDAIYHLAMFDHLHRDGRVLRGEVVSTLLLNAQGEPHQLLGISRDVTERERAATELRQSRDRLATAEQMAHLGNWEFELRTKRIRWSDEMFRIFEVEPRGHRYLLKRFLARVHPDDLRRGKRAFGEAVAKHTRFQLSLRLRFPEGRTKYVEASGEAIYTPEGRAVSAIGTVQDITERRLIELELHDLVKQLGAMHAVAVALDQPALGPEALLDDIARNLPAIARRVDLAQAEIELEGLARRAGIAGAPSQQISGDILINGRAAGVVRLGYVAGLSAADQPSFTVQERETIESIARTIGLSLSARESFTAVQRFNEELEEKVRQRTHELAQRNREVRALLESIPDMVMRLRADGAILSAQRAQNSAALNSLVVGDESGQAFRVADNLQAEAMRIGLRALAERTLITAECEIASPAGPVMVDLRAAPNREDEFVVFLRDITERARLQEAIKESNDRLNLAAKAGGVGIWDYDVRRNKLVWDDQMLRLYGLTREQFGGVGEAWAQGLHPDDRVRGSHEIELALRGEKDFDTEFRVVWPDGTVRDIRAMAQVVRDAAGQPLHMIGTNWDMTAQKQLVRETAAMLEKERQVSEMKTRFISVTSHEFRTPMAAAMGSADLLHNHLERLAPAKREELFNRIHTSMQRMTTMLDDVLTLSRLDAGRMARKLSPTHLVDFVQGVVEEIRLGDREAHEFTFFADCEAPDFPTDTNLLHHIVSNLLSNAARYSPPGTTITTRLSCDGQKAVIAIADRGIGISEADLTRIFEPFERGANVGTIKGTGLGLSIVKRMTEMLGGTVAVESTLAQGTCFTVELPHHPDSTP